MATFIGTTANETITPELVSPTVTASGAAAPSSASDSISAGGGDDLVEGGGGDDIVDLGDGDDHFLYRAFDGGDSLSGGAGFDTFSWFGSEDLFENESVNVSAIGSQIRVDTTTFDGVERLTIDWLDGGPHNGLTVQDLSGTEIRQIIVDFSRLGKDARYHGTTTADIITILPTASNVRLSGLDYTVVMTGALQNNAEVNGIMIVTEAGNDRVDGSAMGIGMIGPRLTMFGGEGNDVLTGGGDHDVMRGDEGNDRLVGSRGIDTLHGGDGTDTIDYTASVAAVTIVLGEGTSQSRGYGGDADGDVISEVEIFVGSAFADSMVGDEEANQFFGGAGSDQLYGGANADRLNGGTGADATGGGAGNDRHFVDHAKDRVVERAGEGTADRVTASVDYVLTAGAWVEHLGTTQANGTAAIDLTGNELDNIVTGNGGANRLSGGGGDDRLIGLGGNDVLRGGSGRDRSEGGAGNDAHYVSDAADIVIDLAGEGNDRVLASVDYILKSGVHVETLSTDAAAGTDAIDLTGNEFGNRVIGNAGMNILQGRGGSDLLTGGDGSDRFRFASVDDAGLGATCDAIQDFEGAGAAGGDRVDLGLIDAVAGGADNAFTFIGTAAFTAPGQLRYVYSASLDQTIVSGNVDGDLTAEFQIAIEGNVGTLIGTDFIL
ncbi:MAG TPA: calcium-binding protein [Allosphingosinicella sp.]|nr:calcium-binding protein [Allosphingosinicella sp.]